MQLRTVKGFRSAEIERYAKASLAPESRVISDELACFLAVKKAGCDHIGTVSEGGRKGVEHPSLKWVNINSYANYPLGGLLEVPNS